MKLRLLMNADCNRSCKGCCNKDWDLQSLPVCKSFRDYSEIILTGGEPMLHPDAVVEQVKVIRNQTSAPIYMYTAFRESAKKLMDVLSCLDGITVTLHTRKDTAPFEDLVKRIDATGLRFKSLRVNVFKGVSTGLADLTHWSVQPNMIWVKDCPLPKDEVFMKVS